MTQTLIARFAVRWILFLFAIAFLFAIPLAAWPAGDASPSEHTPPQEVDLVTYRAQLQAWHGELTQAVSQPSEISRLRATLPKSLVVRVGEVRLKVSNEWIDAGLAQMQSNPKSAANVARELERRLSDMEAATTVPGERGEASAAEAGAKLNKIFERREFRGMNGPSEWELLWRRIGKWIFTHLAELLRPLFVNREISSVIAWVLIGIALLLLARWAWIILAPIARNRDVDAKVAPFRYIQRRWLQDALAAAERDDYREAIHCGYWAGITRLEDAGALKRDRARTPRESLRQLDSQPEKQRMLRELTNRFELVWYGNRDASADDWSGARVQLEKMGCLEVSTAPTASS